MFKMLSILGEKIDIYKVEDSENKLESKRLSGTHEVTKTHTSLSLPLIFMAIFMLKKILPFITQLTEDSEKLN